MNKSKLPPSTADRCKEIRKEVDELLPKLSETLDPAQKLTTVRNVLQSLRREERIRNKGSRGTPVWVLATAERITSCHSDPHKQTGFQ